MAPLLYLDTARLGQTLPAARDAHIDFVRLTTEEPSSLYFEEFLKHGYAAWPGYYQLRFPGLSVWTGIAGLKQTLRRLAGAPDDCEVLLASRSLALVQIAAKAMFQVCRNVLCTDLNWSNYQQAINYQANVSGNQTTIVPLRDFIFHHQWSAEDVVNYLANAYEQHHCDGLFLPAVDHLGIRVPVKRIHERIRQQKPINYTLIDAAQAFCHVPIEDDLAIVDFLITGCHKWMRSGQPMGIGFARSESPNASRDAIAPNSNRQGNQTDPLLLFTAELDADRMSEHFETVSLTSLFAAAGACYRRSVVDGSHPAVTTFRFRPQCRELMHWRPKPMAVDLQSRIAIWKTPETSHIVVDSNRIRHQWMALGYVVSAFPCGTVRISETPLEY